MKTCSTCSTEIQDSFNFCPNCGSDLDRPIVCNKCNYINESNSKFCQECGSPLFEKFKKIHTQTKVANVAVIVPDPSSNGITIEFPFTSAQSFEFAVKEAKSFETFEQFGEDKKAVFRVTLNKNEIYRAKELLLQIKGWRKRTVYVNGEKVLWDSVFDFTWCYERKLSSFKPEYYCFGYENEWDFNVWGCLKAMMPFIQHSRWFTYGKWLNNTGDWEFDKERIRHELAKNLHSHRFCPALNPDLIKEVLDAIPETVNPKKNKRWKFVESYSEANNSLAITTSQYGYEQTKYMIGVYPDGKDFIKDLTDSIKRKLPDYLI